MTRDVSQAPLFNIHLDLHINVLKSRVEHLALSTLAYIYPKAIKRPNGHWSSVGSK